MGIIGWIIFGLIVGAVAKLLMPGRDPGGWIVTILLGIAGALVGVTAQVVKTRITLQLATLDHLRAAETEPLRPARRLHMRR
jgi:uncharacterized membrane protein YeaQ/YmgE (transglycosylase-associated protein family)